jgi:hypothetical protein
MFRKFFSSQTIAPNQSAESEKKREQISKTLNYAQYAMLIYSAYLLLIDGKAVAAIGTAMISTYLEKIASGFYNNNMHDPDTALYIATHYSGITQFSTLFNPVVQPIKNKIVETLTVPDSTRNPNNQ